ncbi:hypothetical protein CFIO01_08625 [Colletotrichum fioriniae PJ7]|uniref:Uncharacterized protein n=1 Tax=Colletotrichum fioriniae PJ7 TaxID=1445577 RepID=A0A010S326_9PEZI|nr:hypothetical protein CFIO01_08625 [Colletotrichum fioriniae PJ7]
MRSEIEIGPGYPNGTWHGYGYVRKYVDFDNRGSPAQWGIAIDRFVDPWWFNHSIQKARFDHTITNGPLVLKGLGRALRNIYTDSLSMRSFQRLVRSPSIGPRDSGMDGPELAKDIKSLRIKHGLVYGEVAEEAVLAIAAEDKTEGIGKQGLHF